MPCSSSMASAAPTKLYSDDVSLVVVLIDTNPFYWTTSENNSTSLTFAHFINHVLPFLNAILLLNQLNQVVLIATGVNSCDYIYDSSLPHPPSANEKMPAFYSKILTKLEDFVSKDQRLAKNDPISGRISSLLSGSLSLALCYIQRIFRAGPLHPQPRILCLQGSPDGPEQYVAIMNAIFSAQRSMGIIMLCLCFPIWLLNFIVGVSHVWKVPIDSCVLGTQNSAFLQQASHITGGIYQKPAYPDGLFQYLSAVFATDLQSRSFLRLPKPPGVDFRASCFCHKETIDMGYICSVCLSIFCKHHGKCSTCGSDFNQSHLDATSTLDRKRKTPEA